MCVNYTTVSRPVLRRAFGADIGGEAEWGEELYRDYLGPIVLHDANGQRQAQLASYSMIPKRHLPPGRDFTTMNARDDTVGQLKSYRSAWHNGRLCLVPMQHFFEPNWEQAQHVRWKIGMADGAPFAVAGLYREWQEDDGQTSFSFTQLTINADQHPLMRRFHRPGEEKRSLVIVPREQYDDWLACRDPELARHFLAPYPAERMAAQAAPKLKKPLQGETAPRQGDLF